MENTIENIDLVILEKAYHELSAEEKTAVNEFIANEQEYNDFKLMLSAVRAQYKEEVDIAPNPQIKEKLLADFQKFSPAVSYNNPKMGLAYFFPNEKGLFNKPGVQILMAAAGIALLIGFAFNLNFDKSINSVAQIDTGISEESLSKNAVTDSNELEETISTESLPESNLEETSKIDQPLSDNSVAKNNKSAETTILANYGASPSIGKSYEPSAGISSRAEMSKDMEHYSPVEMEKEEVSSNTFAATSTVSTNNSYNSTAVDNTIKSKSVSSADKKRSSESDDVSVSKEVTTVSNSQPKKSKSLSENAELITYFYTAM